MSLSNIRTGSWASTRAGSSSMAGQAISRPNGYRGSMGRKPPPPGRDMPADIFVKRRNERLLFFAALSVLTAGSIVITKYDAVAGFTSIGKAFVWGASNFYPDAHAMTKLPEIAQKLWETILMSVAATTI